jgi:hypothetical protein
MHPPFISSSLCAVAPKVQLDPVIHPNLSQEIISSDVEEIVVRDNETDYGTGVLQLNMTIWKLFACGPQVIFDEPSSQIFDIPLADPPRNTSQEEHSEFTFVSSQGGQQSGAEPKRILQKQVVHDEHGQCDASELEV